MNMVLTTLIILIASIVIGTGIVLYGTSLFDVNTATQSSNNQFFKQTVTYYKQGVEPTIETGNYTEKSVIIAVDSQTYKFLLSNRETVDSSGKHIIFYNHKNHLEDEYGVGTFIASYYEGSDMNDIVGSKITIHYSILKPTCVYVFDWGNGFHSRYHVDTFNFTQIPNATNYYFVQKTGIGNSCDDTIKNINKIEVFVK